MAWWQSMGVAYALLGSLTWALALALQGRSPIQHPAPWLALDRTSATLASLVLGGALALVVITSTRLAVARFQWAARLHEELRPVARALPLRAIPALSLLSSVSEELFFRGFLTPWTGVIVQALVFGFLHQTRGKSRWVWASWAALVGLFFGAIFALTGSLLGPVVAHALINGANLTFLRQHDPTRPNRSRLTGMLTHPDG